MKLILLIILSLTFSYAFGRGDDDQEIRICGLYDLSAKIICKDPSICYLDVNADKLSNLMVNITNTPFSLSYFSGVDVKIKVRIYSKGSVVNADVMSKPIRQTSVLKEAGFKLVKRGACRNYQ